MATINLPSGILNTEALTVEIVVTVLPKPGPEDILLDNNSFKAKAGQNFIAVGNLTVIDPIDNQHDISLADLAFDNVYFQVNNGTCPQSEGRLGAPKTYSAPAELDFGQLSGQASRDILGKNAGGISILHDSSPLVFFL